MKTVKKKKKCEHAWVDVKTVRGVAIRCVKCKMTRVCKTHRGSRFIE